MSLSGIHVPDDIVKRYEDKRFERQPGGLVLKLEGETVVIDKDYGNEYDKMLEELPAAEPRYVLYDIPVKNRANLDDVRTVFIFWMPMESPVRMRMSYASTKGIIPKAFRGIATSIQEDEKPRITLDRVQEKINKSQGINNLAI